MKRAIKQEYDSDRSAKKRPGTDVIRTSKRSPNPKGSTSLGTTGLIVESEGGDPKGTTRLSVESEGGDISPPAHDVPIEGYDVSKPVDDKPVEHQDVAKTAPIVPPVSGNSTASLVMHPPLNHPTAAEEDDDWWNKAWPEIEAIEKALGLDSYEVNGGPGRGDV